MGEDGIRRYKFNVHGHLHANRIDAGPRADVRYLNISVECLNDYTPIHVEEVARILKKREKL
jgi:calcineurin-like phosphoesterase family protein